MWCKCSFWLCTLFFVCEEVKTLSFVGKEREVGLEEGAEQTKCIFCLQNKKLQVEISNGIVQGRKQITEKKHMTYYSFQGIPYAQPPVQNLRFRVSFRELIHSSISQEIKTGFSFICHLKELFLRNI